MLDAAVLVYAGYIGGAGTDAATEIAVASLTPQNVRATLPREVASMARPMEPEAKRPPISIDVQPLIRRRLRLAAATRDLTSRIRSYAPPWS